MYTIFHTELKWTVFQKKSELIYSIFIIGIMGSIPSSGKLKKKGLGAFLAEWKNEWKYMINKKIMGLIPSLGNL